VAGKYPFAGAGMQMGREHFAGAKMSKGIFNIFDTAQLIFNHGYHFAETFPK
jgi:hypothetical protein